MEFPLRYILYIVQPMVLEIVTGTTVQFNNLLENNIKLVMHYERCWTDYKKKTRITVCHRFSWQWNWDFRKYFEERENQGTVYIHQRGATAGQYLKYYLLVTIYEKV